MLSVLVLSFVTLNVTILSAIKLRLAMLSFIHWMSLYWVRSCWALLCWISLRRMSPYWVPLCWDSLCWVSLCWMSCLYCYAEFQMLNIVKPNIIMLSVLSPDILSGLWTAVYNPCYHKYILVKAKLKNDFLKKFFRRKFFNRRKKISPNPLSFSSFAEFVFERNSYEYLTIIFNIGLSYLQRGYLKDVNNVISEELPS